MSNAEAPSLPAPIEAHLLLRVEALPSERHPPRRHVPLLPCLNRSNSLLHHGEKMKLIPKEIEATIPDLFSTESVPHPLAVITLFDPYT